MNHRVLTFTLQHIFTRMFLLFCIQLLLLITPSRADVTYDWTADCRAWSGFARPTCMGTASGVLKLRDSYVPGAPVTLADFISWEYSSSSGTFRVTATTPGPLFIFGQPPADSGPPLTVMLFRHGPSFSYTQMGALGPFGHPTGFGTTACDFAPLCTSFFREEFVNGRFQLRIAPRCSGQMATITGTEEDDVLEGTQQQDVIVGLGGNDLIYGLGGDDIICGGSGHDVLLGQNGNDILLGNAGSDVILGGNHHDQLEGNDGSDMLNGGKGNDDLRGGSGNDTLLGSDGEDVLRGGNGNDTLSGGAADDDLSGGDGSDVCDGNQDGRDGDTADGTCELIRNVREPSGCEERFGSVPDFILCQETASTCSFNAFTDGGTCDQMCRSQGSRCVGALDNHNDEGVECIPIGRDTCQTPRTTEICICER